MSEATLIYLGGGKPQVLLGIFRDTLLEQAILGAHKQGAMLAGASAGAMALGQAAWSITAEVVAQLGPYFEGQPIPPDFRLPPISMVEGYNLAPGMFIGPHLNALPPALREAFWAAMPSDLLLVGIDEQTALVGSDRQWEVRGRGAVMLRRGVHEEIFRAGQSVRL
ncbi:MAG: Type 1 glutamine amidotransferase-like domain-containing protein [Chloroflexi bacterium]|nr:Type 1 glutamine amidotransferase-like domain-containing protein [Chloroflexota bacterium]